MEPASIRTKNPGAMWGSPLARKWGSTATLALNDGLGQGNNIAVFKNYVDGICAQIDLWRTPRYKNKRFADAIAVWAGGNHVASYVAFVKARVPGMTENTIINDALLSSDMGVKFLKAQAAHEAGRVYPAPDADWITAQKRVFGPQPKAPTSSAGKATGAVVAAGTATAAAHHAGLGIGWVVLVAAIAAAGGAGWWFRQVIIDKIKELRARV